MTSYHRVRLNQYDASVSVSKYSQCISIKTSKKNVSFATVVLFGLGKNFKDLWTLDVKLIGEEKMSGPSSNLQC